MQASTRQDSCEAMRLRKWNVFAINLDRMLPLLECLDVISWVAPSISNSIHHQLLEQMETVQLKQMP